jgi:hypothetical protein
MHVHIDASHDGERERIIQLLQFSLKGHREDIDSLQLNVATIHDRLGTELRRCRLRAALRQGPAIEVDEVQSRLDLAVTRALERCIRTIQRRLGTAALRRSA